MATKPSIAREFGNADGIGAVPAAVAGSCVATEYGQGLIRKTRFTFTAFGVTVVDQTTNGAWGGTQFYTFPEGRIVILGSVSSLTFTTTSVLASTLNASSANVEFGVGTAVAGAVLATTAMNVTPGTGQTTSKFTSSATINVASAAATSALVVSSTAQFDGTTTAAALFLNIGVTAANHADSDGDSTIAVNGTVDVVWFCAGDY